MKCCGVHSYEDFSKATEFRKYVLEEDKGQQVPEACCMLKNDRKPEELAKQLFDPIDANCISTPTTSNSYMNQVCITFNVILVMTQMQLLTFAYMRLLTK